MTCSPTGTRTSATPSWSASRTPNRTDQPPSRVPRPGPAGRGHHRQGPCRPVGVCVMKHNAKLRTAADYGAHRDKLLDLIERWQDGRHREGELMQIGDTAAAVEAERAVLLAMAKELAPPLAREARERPGRMLGPYAC